MATAPNFDNLSSQINSSAPGVPALSIVPPDNAQEPAAPALPEVLDSGEVCFTTDYGMFNRLGVNRKVRPAHVQEIIGKIREKNLLHIRPIDVNENFSVFDGQHRLEAAKELGLVIYYRVVPGLTEEDIARLNTATSNWTNKDYLHFWTEKGNSDYRKLANFLNDHASFSITTGQLLMAGNDGCKSDMFKSGYFKAGDTENGYKVAALIEWISKEAGYKYAFDSRFVAAVHHCCTRVAKFDVDTFKRKILLQPTALKRCVSQPQYLDHFEQIYNYKMSQENRLRFR